MFYLPLPFQFYLPPQFFLFPFSTILLFSLVNVFIPSSTIIYYFPSSMFLIPLHHNFDIFPQFHYFHFSMLLFPPLQFYHFSSSSSPSSSNISFFPIRSDKIPLKEWLIAHSEFSKHTCYVKLRISHEYFTSALSSHNDEFYLLVSLT